MAPQPPGSTPAAPAPDSPRPSESPPPSGAQGELELELLGLAQALYNLGTTVINDLTKERDKPGGGKPVGARVNDVVGQLATLDAMAEHVRTMVPLQTLADIDGGRNPMQLTRERLERAATENQFMNGKIAAIQVRKRNKGCCTAGFLTPASAPAARGRGGRRRGGGGVGWGRGGTGRGPGPGDVRFPGST